MYGVDGRTELDDFRQYTSHAGRIDDHHLARHVIDTGRIDDRHDDEGRDLEPDLDGARQRVRSSLADTDAHRRRREQHRTDDHPHWLSELR